jgi:hypothetical protein
MKALSFVNKPLIESNSRNWILSAGKKEYFTPTIRIMKKYLFIFLLPFFAFTGFDWISVKLDDRVTMNFPSEPEKKDMGGNEVWVAQKDGKPQCMAMILDFSQFGLDSAGLEAEIAKEETFVQFRDGVLGQMPGSQLVSERKMTVKGKACFEYLIDMNKDDKSQGRMYNRNIFAGNKMYSISYFMREGDDDALRERFFGSFQIR